PPLPPEATLALRVLLYGVIFALSVGGNALVLWVLGRSRRLRTVTNCFLLSLALSDLLLALCCMPFTLVPSLMGTFIFGEAVCKIMAYLMGATCGHLVPLRYPLVPLRCQLILFGTTWCHLGATCGHLVPLSHLVPLGTTLVPLGATQMPADTIWHHLVPLRYVLLLLVLFFVPGLVMTVAYGLISRELYRGIRFELGTSGHTPARHQDTGASSELAPPCDEGDGCYLQLSRPGTAVELRALGTHAERARINGSSAKLVAKRRVIRMLVVIVATFFLCWLPVFAANTWRAFSPRAAQRALSGTPISFIHLLSYTSACANPLIYCFMNRRFRQAFGATCARCRPRARPRRPPDEEVPPASASLSKFSYTTVSSIGAP
ncbi:CCKAR protein, partial [Upupa epops]|nr:CCKAR protein [Upupa epops]